jgi:hypothetical protein
MFTETRDKLFVGKNIFLSITGIILGCGIGWLIHKKLNTK